MVDPRRFEPFDCAQSRLRESFDELRARPELAEGMSGNSNRSFPYRSGSKSSRGLPSGSSNWICLPPGPTSISLRKRSPAFFSAAMRAGRSATWRSTRFHPPGSWRLPSGIGRDPEAPGPLRTSFRLPTDTWANAGKCCWSSLNPSCWV